MLSRTPLSVVCGASGANQQRPSAVERAPAPAKNPGTAIHELFRFFEDVELELPPHEPARFNGDNRMGVCAFPAYGRAS